eukprot:scaffold261720_cov15-Tisochrysis_lutea.AAC.1
MMQQSWKKVSQSRATKQNVCSYQSETVLVARSSVALLHTAAGVLTFEGRAVRACSACCVRLEYELVPVILQCVRLEYELVPVILQRVRLEYEL